MIEVFSAAGRAAWGHILPPAALDSLHPPMRWQEAIIDPLQVVLVAEMDRPPTEVGSPSGAPKARGVVGLAVVRASEDHNAADTGELDSFYTHPAIWGA